MYDMTPLTRYEVAGAGAAAFLQRMTTNNVDKSVGSVTYTLLLDENGGIRSDITVARLADTRFQVGVNGPMDFDWFSRHLPGDVTLRDITGGTCCVGVWGPRARDMVAPLCPDDLSHEAFKYFRALQTYLGAIPVTMLRVSYVGELGWEIYTSAEYGAALWDLLFEAGQAHDVIAAGRIAFNSLRIEKGYRLWGTDMTAEHQPAAAGVEFAVKMTKDDFIGKTALEHAAAPQKVLRSIVFDEPTAVVLGKEPVFVDDRLRRLRDQRRVFADDRTHHRLRLAARRNGGGRPRRRRLPRHPVCGHRARRARGRSRDGADQEVALWDTTSSSSVSAGWAAPPRITWPPGVSACSGWRSSLPHTTRAPATAGRASSGSPTSRTRPTCRCCCGPTNCGTNSRPTPAMEVYRLTGGLFIGPPDALTVAGSLRASREWGLPHEMLDAAEIRRRFPTFTPNPGDIALYEAKAGFARPEMTVQAHIDLAETAGADTAFR